jgi:hypothetical protein
MGCGEHVLLLAPRLREIDQLGVRTVFIGNGAANYIEGFEDRNLLRGAPVEIVTDPTLNSFRAASLHRNVLGAAGPTAIKNQLRAFVRGVPPRLVEGDLWQQGGVLIIDRQSQLAFHHADPSTGAHAEIGDVMDTVLRVAGEGQAVA